MELDSKLIGPSSEPTPPICIEYEEMLMGVLNELCSGGVAQLLDAIKLGSSIIFHHLLHCAYQTMPSLEIC